MSAPEHSATYEPKPTPPNPGLYGHWKPKYAGDGPAARDGYCRGGTHDMKPRRIGILRRERLVCSRCLYGEWM